MIFVEMEVETDLSAELVERAARAALDLAGSPDADLTVVLAGDEQVRALNRRFLGRDAPTDVLAFPADEPDPETGRRYLGDVVLSVPRAGKQAAARGHDAPSEIALLVVHGVLHLLGHDHVEDEEKARMWAAQAEALKRLGISPSLIHE